MFEYLQDRLDRATAIVEENKEAPEDRGRTPGESSRRIIKEVVDQIMAGVPDTDTSTRNATASRPKDKCVTALVREPTSMHLDCPEA